MRSVCKKLFALSLVLALIFSLASCSLTDDHSDAETTTELRAITPLPQGNESILAYVSKVLSIAESGTPSFNLKIRTDAYDFECENGLVKSAFPTLKRYMLQSSSEDVAFGSEFYEKLPGEQGITAIDPSAVKTVSAEWPDIEKNTTTAKANEYNIVIEFNDDLSVSDVMRYFGITDKAEVLKEFEKSAEYFKLNDYSSEYTGCRAEIRVDVQTDKITWLSVTRGSVVTASATCLGNLSSAGDITATFKFAKIYEFKDFAWTAPKVLKG